MSPTKRKRQKGKPDGSSRPSVALTPKASAEKASAEPRSVDEARASCGLRATSANVVHDDAAAHDFDAHDASVRNADESGGSVFSSAITAPLPKIAAKRDAPKKRAKRALRRAEGKKRASGGEGAPAAESDALAAGASDGKPQIGFEDEGAKGTAADDIGQDAREGSVDAPDASGQEGADGASGEQSDEARPSRRSAKPSGKARKAASIAAGVAAVIVIAGFALFSWDRWLRYDDAADFEGSWIAEGGTTPLSISGEEIVLARDAVLSYRIDPFAKTISYELGDVSGQGRYRFSADRQQLAIDDGDASWFDTFSADIAYALQSAFATLVGSEPPTLSATPDGVVLAREGAAASSAGTAGEGAGGAAGSDGVANDGEAPEAAAADGFASADGVVSDAADSGVAASDQAG